MGGCQYKTRILWKRKFRYRYRHPKLILLDDKLSQNGYDSKKSKM